jgi:signal peptidase I
MLKRKKEKKKPKTTLGKIWYFIWEDDSALSWIVNIILAIVLIKFVIYPGLGLLLGTGFPIVAVVSDSMEHEDIARQNTISFDSWWQIHADFYNSKNVTISEFKKFPFKNGFNKGDLMVLVGTSPEKTSIGDVIVFMAGRPDPIIHRVVEIKIIEGVYVYETKGDNNQKQIESYWLDEKKVTENLIVGKAVLRIPYFGWVKIAAVEIFQGMINVFR